MDWSWGKCLGAQETGDGCKLCKGPASSATWCCGCQLAPGVPPCQSHTRYTSEPQIMEKWGRVSKKSPASQGGSLHISDSSPALSCSPAHPKALHDPNLMIQVPNRWGTFALPVGKCICKELVFGILMMYSLPSYHQFFKSKQKKKKQTKKQSKIYLLQYG